jgi:DNA ligase (NAD+)
MNIATLYSAMVDRINLLDHAYWVQNEPLVSDQQYDREMQSLIAFEKDHPDLVSVRSPTQRIGGGLASGFVSRPHVLPCLSLDNVFKPSDLEQKILGWHTELGIREDIKMQCIVEPKIDGLSLDLKYKHGDLVQALTRGNGTEGDDVTTNAKTIHSIPFYVPGFGKDSDIHVRGEVFLTFEDFKLINERQETLGREKFANPRNAASGSMKLLDSFEVAQRRLSFMPYHVLNGCHTLVPVYQDELHGWFKDMGFKAVPWFKVGDNVEDVVDWVMKFEALRPTMTFPVDGAVIKLNYRPCWDQLTNSTRAVRWGYAYKYAPSEVETVLNSITVQVGRTGALAPVAELEPVEIDGSVIGRASLHNFDEIDRLDVRVGDTVVIAKQGEIIPNVVRVVKAKRNKNCTVFVPPEACPICQSPVEKKTLSDGKTQSVAIYCNNKQCPAIRIGSIIHWAAKAQMDIEGLGESSAESLFNLLHVDSIDKLYELTVKSLRGVSGNVFGAKEAENLYNAIQASKDRGMEAVLAGLGIDHIGNTLARKLALRYEDLWAFLNTDTPELQKQVGPVVLKSLEDNDEWIRIMVMKLEKHGVNLKSKTFNPAAASGALAGKSICFTGTLSMDRDEAARLAEAKGAKVVNSISKKLSYLVVGDSAGSKLDKAKALGTVQIIGEEDFLKLIGKTDE